MSYSKKPIKKPRPVQQTAQVATIMRIVNFYATRNSLTTLIDQVPNDADYTVIARRDAPDAVVMTKEPANGTIPSASLAAEAT